MSIVTELRDEFIKEAIGSPMLLSDLSSMETYIAESYQNRSIIELLQNADDATATKFKILRVDNVLFVANNGRNFNNKDIKSICRSGASTKTRGDGHIGYRGIGFKSVVNFAEIVHIISNDLSFTFSKKLTNSLLEKAAPENLPLIRVPHPLTPQKDFSNIINEFFEENYNVVFVFENININQIDSEIERFDPSSLMFLRNIKHVKLQNGFTQEITTKRTLDGSSEYVDLFYNGEEEKWLVIRDSNDKSSPQSVALLLDNENKIVPLDISKSVVHSFMPTQDLVGLPLKINSDFSTDPSRTKVVFDEQTIEHMKLCVNIIVNIIQDFISFKKKKYNGILDLFNKPFSNHYSQFKISKEFKEYFILELERQVNNIYITTENGLQRQKEIIKIQPNWLNENDFLNIVSKNSFYSISKKDEQEINGLINFCKIIGINELSIEDVTLLLPTQNLSKKGKAEILIEFIRRNRFNLTAEKINLFNNYDLIVMDNNNLNQDFLKMIIEIADDQNDVSWFFNQFNINIPSDIFHKLDNPVKSIKEQLTSNTLISDQKIRFSPSIQKWRSVEKNLKVYLETLEGVSQVNDVSKSNLGYDLEVHMGLSIEYIEVKSVDKIGASFSLTNNEYATANELTDKFSIAIVKQTEEGLDICFIKNPINTLNLVKRVTKWEWICDEYSGNILRYNY